MLLVALTGGIGSGKSEAAHRFAARGASIVDSDALAREVVEPGTAGLQRIVDEFGPGVLLDDQSLDREGLGRIVFGDDDARRRLNAIVHPLVGDLVATRIIEAAQQNPDGVVINDIPLLVEGNVADRYQAVVVVDVPVEVQLDRLVRLRGMTEADARARIAAQATREQRLAVADHVIVNDGDLDALDAAVDKVWAALRSRMG